MRARSGSPRLAWISVSMRPGRRALTLHALRAEFFRQPEGQGVDRAFRAGVVDIEVWRAEARGGRRHQHDRTARAAGRLRHATSRLARREIRAEHVDLEDPPHALGAHVGEPRARGDDPGVGDNSGQRPQRVGRLFEDGDDVGFARDVALERDRPSAPRRDLPHDRVGRFGVEPVIDADGPAVAGGEQGAGAADAARGAGNEQGFRHGRSRGSLAKKVG